MRIPDHIRRHLVTLLPGREDVQALPRTWRRDVLAGLTVGVVALPLALAFGVSSGMGAAAGLVTAIVAGIVAAIFGGSHVQVSGPTGAMAVILAPIVAVHGPHAVVVISMLAGLILVAAGVLRLGRVAVYIPWPVIEGFTAGIAVIIALQQIPFALDVRTPAEHAAFRRVADAARLTRYGLDCYAYALLAAGHVDLVIEAGLQSYDVAGPIAVVQAAGGVATNWQGGPAHDGGTIIAAGSPELHAEALALLNGD